MSDRYQDLIHTPIGQLLAKNLGLPNPVRLDRYSEGDPLVDGTVLVGGSGRLEKAVVAALDDLGISAVSEADPDPTARYKGLVFDATGITSSEQLAELQEFFTPLMRRLDTCARIVVLGTPPEATNDRGERVAQRALEGFTRSVGKEIGRGGAVQLVYVTPAADGAITSTLGFLLSPKSAYVSGQVVVDAVARACKNGTATRAEVLKELHKTNLKKSVFGDPIRFDAHGDRIGAHFFQFKITNKGSVPVG